MARYECRDCGEPIGWLQSKAGRWYATRPGSRFPHFKECRAPQERAERQERDEQATRCCGDYHYADCPLRTAYQDAYAGSEWDR